MYFASEGGARNPLCIWGRERSAWVNMRLTWGQRKRLCCCQFLETCKVSSLLLHFDLESKAWVCIMCRGDKEPVQLSAEHKFSNLTDGDYLAHRSLFLCLYCQWQVYVWLGVMQWAMWNYKQTPFCCIIESCATVRREGSGLFQLIYFLQIWGKLAFMGWVFWPWGDGTGTDSDQSETQNYSDQLKPARFTHHLDSPRHLLGKVPVWNLNPLNQTQNTSTSGPRKVVSSAEIAHHVQRKPPVYRSTGSA